MTRRTVVAAAAGSSARDSRRALARSSTCVPPTSITRIFEPRPPGAPFGDVLSSADSVDANAATSTRRVARFHPRSLAWERSAMRRRVEVLATVLVPDEGAPRTLRASLASS